MSKAVAKDVTKYVCQECGSFHSKWSGKCDGCHAWNTLVQEVVAPRKIKAAPVSSVSFVSMAGEEQPEARLMTGLDEFDRVCGGGIVPGSVILLGGDPGIGKSTLLLQVVSALSKKMPCAYVSGEEAIAQVRRRALRLGVTSSDQLHLAAGTNVSDILNAVDSLGHTPLLIIDSIQTMAAEGIESAPGTVSQVRAASHELITYAKKQNVAMILVGHVTKEGTLAGPRVLEHMVDTVLYFEGERNYQYRILRSVKNRFGATDELGVFEMTDQGLSEVANPSALFLSNHEENVTGSAVFAGIEGTRPLLVEIQALVAPTYLTSPRRTTVGWDAGRLSMILAVLETRCGLTFSNKDVYLNVAGGLRITEPAVDLAVAAALMSALLNVPLPQRSVFFGEIGLVGEVRTVCHTDLRLREASKLGFEQACCALNPTQKEPSSTDMETINTFRYVIELMDLLPK